MAYASIADMVLWFGEREIARASTPDEMPVAGVVPAPVTSALENASAIIDGYLRRRYQVPLAVAPSEISRACGTLARYDLLTGGSRQASEQIRDDRKEAMAWLRRISEGTVLLDLQEVSQGDESFATMQSRRDVFSDRQGHEGGGGFWDGLP